MWFGADLLLHSHALPPCVPVWDINTAAGAGRALAFSRRRGVMLCRQISASRKIHQGEGEPGACPRVARPSRRWVRLPGLRCGTGARKRLVKQKRNPCGMGWGERGGETCGGPCLCQPRGSALAAAARTLPSTQGPETGETALSLPGSVGFSLGHPGVPGRAGMCRGQQGTAGARCAPSGEERAEGCSAQGEKGVWDSSQRGVKWSNSFPCQVWPEISSSKTVFGVHLTSKRWFALGEPSCLAITHSRAPDFPSEVLAQG